MMWDFPIRKEDLTNTTRLTSEEGSFGYKRSYYYHQGVDIYVTGATVVYAVEPGTVVAVENFTGPAAGHEHWLDTKAVLVEGASGVVCYGEVVPYVKVGDIVDRGEPIAQVTPVLPEGAERPDIFGHSRFMLHFEWYNHGVRESTQWHHDDVMDMDLRDPTEPLRAAWSRMLTERAERVGTRRTDTELQEYAREIKELKKRVRLLEAVIFPDKK